MSNTVITRKQWNVLNQTVSSARVLLQGRIDYCLSKQSDPVMYEEWLAEAEEARKALSDICARMPFDVWFETEEAA